MKSIAIAILISCSLSACANKSPTIKVAKNSSINKQLNSQAAEIKQAIEKKFYNISSFSGKSCTLRLQFAPDASLLSVKSEGGDPELCHAALEAASQAKYPPFINDKMYNIFKNAALDFKL
ncbi:cell envelope integrity protein TolA [uncultured Cedecea sp.]|uniref:cell envelope integrity protein TolA n=1 Tax=uncultured Cedecea sp. TaxID=988762 RepID=UPI0026366D26|nr:cell envelope integrity protein TolA [uncultured Cedecea sp.]